MNKQIPAATYRLQLNHRFTFKNVSGITDYLHGLGISHCYTSPFLKARKESNHGYDVIDHSTLNPEIGTEEEFIHLAEDLKSKEMGMMVDMIPNHMCVFGNDNRWWNDVLENGPSSPFSDFFDIDWNSPKVSLINTVLLPLLGEQYGKVLESQQLRVSYEEDSFRVNYYESHFPIDPGTWNIFLEPVLETAKTFLEDAHPDVLEMESILTALKHLPLRTEIDPEKVNERQREKEIIKKRFSALVHKNPEISKALTNGLKELNGIKGQSHSFDRLETVLKEQTYRLCYWRVAADEVNYRRFFDINDLAAIRMENPQVFQSTHELIFRYIKEGWVTAIRIDHIDGLFDPEQYLKSLKESCLSITAKNEFYIIAEKILCPKEQLKTEWPIHGTTGYDFLNLLNGLFVDKTHAGIFYKIYKKFTGYTTAFRDLIVTCKKFIMLISMSSELHVLASQLDQISEQHRWSRDFTFESLRFALREVIGCYPVYRSYTRLGQEVVDPEDRKHILFAVRQAKNRNHATDETLFDFIGSVLLLEDPEGLDENQRAVRRNFVMKFQQVTGPVMAKGLEDTAFYRYFPLASLNEVGADLEQFGVSIESFHENNRERYENYPYSLLASSTHDAKRSEDVRSRINVLSEMPVVWERAIRRWQRFNRSKKNQINERDVPNASEEYLLYQTLVGTWPLFPLDEKMHMAYVSRIQDYMTKALREAKLQTIWINPNLPYEEAVRKFVGTILKNSPKNKFLADFINFQKSIVQAGMFNSISQTLLKIASPGIPDFYQGTEVWNLSLVDPDNRNLVDYTHLKDLLSSIQSEPSDSFLEGLLGNMNDGRIKLFVTERGLNFRRTRNGLFTQGKYLALPVIGEKAQNIISFARVLEDHVAIVVAPRFFTKLTNASPLPLGQEIWKDTAIVLDGLGEAMYLNIFTNQKTAVQKQDEKWIFPVSEILSKFPIALLEKV